MYTKKSVKYKKFISISKFCKYGKSWGYLTLGLCPFSVSASPVLDSVSSGQVIIEQNEGVTLVRQTSQNIDLNWKSFNLGSQQRIDFIQPGREAIAVNRILDVQASQIVGQIHSNGQVWLLNPNGIVFGAGAKVNVGSLVASTLQLGSSEDSLFRLRQGTLGGKIVNHGDIKVGASGYIALVAMEVTNYGKLSAPLGSVNMLAGSEISFRLSGNELFDFSIDQSVMNNVVENHGYIQADGGRVLLNAGARDSLLASMVNVSGVVEAKSVIEHEGQIILLSGMAAGTTELTGRLDASDGANESVSSGEYTSNKVSAGFIETSGKKVNIAKDSIVTTYSKNGSGTWLIDPNNYTIASEGGDITGEVLSDKLALNNIQIQSDEGSKAGDGNIYVNDVVSWASNNNLTLSAKGDVFINKAITATGSEAALSLQYGLGAAAVNNNAEYHINAAVNLRAGDNLSTQLGFDGAVKNFTVITGLGVEGSANGADLQGMLGDLNNNYALGRDIEAGLTKDWNSGKGFVQIGNDSNNFTGDIEGLGHKIKDLTIKRPEEHYIGFIGDAAGGTISNLGLVNVDIEGKSLTGGIAGRTLKGNIKNSYVTGKVSGLNTVGGILGQLNGSGGTIKNNYSTAAVKGQQSVGGLVGYLVGGNTIHNSYTTGAVEAKYTVGGLVGFNSGSIENSYATGDIKGIRDVGGLVGGQFGPNILNSYAFGNVSGDDKRIGGLVGRLNSGVVTNSYSTGLVSGTTEVGGLVGAIGASASVANSYWSLTSSGQSNSAGGVGKDGEDLKLKDTFSTWSISEEGGSDKTWRIYQGRTMPLLRSYLKTYEAGTPVEKEYNGELHSLEVADNILSSVSLSSSAYRDAGNYTLGGELYSNQQGYDVKTTDRLALKITPKTVQLSSSKTYNGNSSIDLDSVTVSGLIDGDELNPSGQLMSSSKQVGEHSLLLGDFVSGNNNYIASNDGNTVVIHPKEVYLSGRRVYDGSRDLAISTIQVEGLISGDQLGLTGEARLAGGNTGQQNIVINGLSAGNANYLLAADGHAAIIDQRAVTISTNREYDGSHELSIASLSISNIIEGDDLLLAGVVLLEENGAGSQIIDTGNLVIANPNYRVSSNGHLATVTPKVISISASRTYIGSKDLSLALINVEGVLAGDVVDLVGTASLSGGGAGEQIIDTSLLEIDNDNYTLSSSESLATISPKSIQLSANKVYDGLNTLDAKLLTSTDTVAGELLSFNGSVILESKNVGLQVLSTSNVSLNNRNYFLMSEAMVSITPKLVSVSATAIDKTFDQSLTAGVIFNLSDDFAKGDEVSLSHTSALFSDWVGEDLTVYVDGISLQGADASNYSLGNTTLKLLADITPMPDVTGMRQSLETGSIQTSEMKLINPRLDLSQDLRVNVGYREIDQNSFSLESSASPAGVSTSMVSVDMWVGSGPGWQMDSLWGKAHRLQVSR